MCPNSPIIECVDFVETHKILHHEYQCEPDNFFCIPLKELRGHQYKLHKLNFNTGGGSKTLQSGNATELLGKLHSHCTDF